MHRAFGRAIRGTCRKWRENECPVAAGEEVRKNKEDESKKDFVPPKHTWEEAVTWTAGLVLGYQLTHHRRRNQILFGEKYPSPAADNTGAVCCVFQSGSVSESSTCDEVDSSSPSSFNKKSSSACPFAVSSRVFNQPIFNLENSTLNVKSSQGQSSSTVIPSIDVQPFIYDQAQDLEPAELVDTTINVIDNSKNNGRSISRISFITEEDDDDDDDGIVFAEEDPPPAEPEMISPKKKNLRTFSPSPSPSQSTFSSTSTLTPAESAAADYGRRFGGDLLSILGAFEFLKAESNAKPLEKEKGKKTAKKLNKKKQRESSSFTSINKKNGVVFGKNPQLHAIDLMQKGAALGSGRALYNIGVAYDRMKDAKLAKEYYQKAAELDHPLAIYNCAVFALREGRLTEGYALMKTASDYGVPEAKTFLKEEHDGVSSKLANMQVGNTS